MDIDVIKHAVEGVPPSAKELSKKVGELQEAGLAPARETTTPEAPKEGLWGRVVRKLINKGEPPRNQDYQVEASFKKSDDQGKLIDSVGELSEEAKEFKEKNWQKWKEGADQELGKLKAQEEKQPSPDELAARIKKQALGATKSIGLAEQRNLVRAVLEKGEATSQTIESVNAIVDDLMKQAGEAGGKKAGDLLVIKRQLEKTTPVVEEAIDLRSGWEQKTSSVVDKAKETASEGKGLVEKAKQKWDKWKKDPERVWGRVSKQGIESAREMHEAFGEIGVNQIKQLLTSPETANIGDVNDWIRRIENETYGVDEKSVIEVLFALKQLKERMEDGVDLSEAEVIKQEKEFEELKKKELIDRLGEGVKEIDGLDGLERYEKVSLRIFVQKIMRGGLEGVDMEALVGWLDTLAERVKGDGESELMDGLAQVKKLLEGEKIESEEVAEEAASSLEQDQVELGGEAESSEESKEDGALEIPMDTKEEKEAESDGKQELLGAENMEELSNVLNELGVAFDPIDLVDLSWLLSSKWNEKTLDQIRKILAKYEVKELPEDVREK